MLRDVLPSPVTNRSSPLTHRALTPTGVALAILLLASFYLYVFRPGLVPFIWDEPQLFFNAFEQNALKRRAVHGLPGSLQKFYGPVPTWLYQIFLALSNDIISVVRLKIIFTAAITFLGLIWLARTSGLWVWGLFAALASPYIWFYTRLTWDNPFNIPLGILAFAAYGTYLRTRREGMLFVAVMVAGTMLLVHFMALPLCFALMAHMLRCGPTPLRSRLTVTALGLLLIGIIAAPYWVEFFSSRPASPEGGLAWQPFAFPFLGPRQFSGLGLDYFFLSGDERPLLEIFSPNRCTYLLDAGAWSSAFVVSSAITAAAFPISCLGIYALAKRKLADGVAHQLGLIALLALLLNIPLNGFARAAAQPHYFNGVSAAYLLVLWTGIHLLSGWKLKSVPWGKLLVGFYLAALGCTTSLLAFRLTQTDGTRGSHFGASLEQQQRIIDEASKVPGMNLMSLDLKAYGFFRSYLFLIFWNRKNPPQAAEAVTGTIEYARPDDPHSAELVLKVRPVSAPTTTPVK